MLQDIQAETGITWTRLQDSATKFGAKFNAAGLSFAESGELMQRTLTAAADQAAFYDKSVEDVTAALYSFMKGNTNALDSINVAATAAGVAQYAMETYGKSMSDLSDAEKEIMRLEYATSLIEHSDAAGQAARESEAYENVLGNLKEAWRQFKAVVGEPILQNIVLPAMQALIGIIGQAQEKVSSFIGNMKEFISAFDGVQSVSDVFAVLAEKIGMSQVVLEGLAGILAAVTAGIIAYKVAQSAAAVITAIATAATTAFGAVMAVVTSPVFLITAAIVALIAIIAICITHWDEFKAMVASAVDGIKTAVSNMVDSVKEKFNAMKEAISAKIEAIKSAIETKWEAIKSAVTSKVDSIKSDVSAKFEAIVSTIQSKLQSAQSTVQSIFDNIKSSIKEKIDGAKSAVQTGIDAIKSIFNFSWSLPHLALPHFSISGGFSISPPSVPHFSVSWYAKGGVFDMPTLFGYGNGQIGGLGEHGAEAVVPLENNTEWLDKIAERLGAGQNTKLVLQLDKKVLAEGAISGINDLTRQTGSLGLIFA